MGDFHFCGHKLLYDIVQELAYRGNFAQELFIFPDRTLGINVSSDFNDIGFQGLEGIAGDMDQVAVVFAIGIFFQIVETASYFIHENKLGVVRELCLARHHVPHGCMDLLFQAA